LSRIFLFIRYKIDNATLLNLKMSFENLPEVRYPAQRAGNNEPDLFSRLCRHMVIEETPVEEHLPS